MAKDTDQLGTCYLDGEAEDKMNPTRQHMLRSIIVPAEVGIGT
jgi:hypothetical protein